MGKKSYGNSLLCVGSEKTERTWEGLTGPPSTPLNCPCPPHTPVIHSHLTPARHFFHASSFLPLLFQSFQCFSCLQCPGCPPLSPSERHCHQHPRYPFDSYAVARQTACLVSFLPFFLSFPSSPLLSSSLPACLLSPFFKGSHVAQASIELMILLPPPSECWDYRRASLHPVCAVVFLPCSTSFFSCGSHGGGG